MHKVNIGGVSVANDAPLTVISGPCQLESEDHALMIAHHMADVCRKYGAQFIFKGSFDKANRTSIEGKRGLGIDAGLAVLQSVKDHVACPVLTDVHTTEQCAKTAQVCDVLQIPAFLCRQTDLLIAAGQTGAAINVKKGQFLAPWDMKNIVDKIESTGNQNLLLTERGTTFGYNALVADMRSLPEMAKTGYPVIMDATHAVAQPGGLGGASGGQREFAPVLARAAVSLGIAGVFLETHQAPNQAPSDGPNMVHLPDMDGLVETLMQFDKLAKSNPVNITKR